MATAPTALERNIQSKTVARFRGISQHRSIVGQPWEWAQDCLNVIVGAAGFLEKLRAGVSKSALQVILGSPSFPIDTMYDFQQAIGTRQLVCNFPSALGYFTEPVIGGQLVFNLIESLAADSPRFSYVDSNNLLFMANGRRMLKWTGTALQNWGIVGPVAAPQMGVTVPIQSIQRAGGVVTVLLNIAGFASNGAFNINQLTDVGLQVGDMVRIAGVFGDVTLNGAFAITGTAGAFGFTFNSAGGNVGPFAQGTATISDIAVANIGGSADFKITQVVRAMGTVTITIINQFRIQPGEEFTMSGWGASAPAFPQFNGTFVCTASDAGSVSFFLDGPDIPATAIGPVLPLVVGGFTDVIGPRTWRYTYSNSVTGEESVASPPSVFIPNATTTGLVNNVRAYLTAAASPDPQVDTINWFACLDGGADWFLVTSLSIANGYVLSDGKSDDLLDVTQRANFINFPPPVGNFLSKWQGRIYLVPNSNPQSIVYSGYEKILRGRPESSFPPGNQILMQIGAQAIKGHGPLMNGVVIWDNNNKMFMFKGTVEDIVTNQPVNYSEQLEEMPWQVGTLSHQCIQPTPYGLVWVGNDFAVHKWNGIFYGEIIGPVDISINIAPLMARITPGTGTKIQSAYFNFLERDWYVILIAIDGSQTYNRIVFFDMTKEAADNMGVFVSDIAADSITVRVDANEVRHLLISVGGIVYEIKAATTATAGIHKAITNTNAQLNAFWLSGYDGNDDAMMMKLYRWGRLITDQDGFSVLVTLVDDVDSTLANPTNFQKFDGMTQSLNKFSVNWNARRISINIGFPSFDVDASVLQLIMTHIPGSIR